MRVHELYGDLFEAVATDGIQPEVRGSVRDGLPPSFQHSMPATHAFPDMDSYYGFYRFVIAMAGYPEDTSIPLQSRMRDIPLAVAYTKQEHDMIHATAKRMGVKADELAYHGSKELPDTFTKSPVMKFHMPESQQRRLKDVILLSEAMIDAPL